MQTATNNLSTSVDAEPSGYATPIGPWTWLLALAIAFATGLTPAEVLGLSAGGMLTKTDRVLATAPAVQPVEQAQHEKTRPVPAVIGVPAPIGRLAAANGRPGLRPSAAPRPSERVLVMHLALPPPTV